MVRVAPPRSNLSWRWTRQAKKDLMSARWGRTDCWKHRSRTGPAGWAYGLTPGDRTGLDILAANQEGSEGSHHGCWVPGRVCSLRGGIRDVAAPCQGGRMGSHRSKPRCWMTRPTARDASLCDVADWSDVCGRSGVALEFRRARPADGTNAGGWTTVGTPLRMVVYATTVWNETQSLPDRCCPPPRAVARSNCRSRKNCARRLRFETAPTHCHPMRSGSVLFEDRRRRARNLNWR